MKGLMKMICMSKTELEKLCKKYGIKRKVDNAVFAKSFHKYDMIALKYFIELLDRVVSREKMVEPHVKFCVDDTTDNVQMFVVDYYEKTDQQAMNEIDGLILQEREKDLQTFNVLKEKWGW